MPERNEKPRLLKNPVEIIHLNKAMTTEEAKAELDHRDFRPATLLELLLLVETDPAIRKRFTVAALGTDCRVYGKDHAPYFERDDRSNVLRMFFGAYPNTWDASVRFAAVRK
jgi:hypothetical protein